MMHRSSTWGFRVRSAFLLGMGVPALLGAQGAALRYNVLYACPDPLRLMVLSCTGEDPSATCEMQGYNLKQPTRRRPVPRTQVNAMLQMCHVQTRAEAEADAHGGQAMNGGGAMGQAESNGIRVGDQVEVVTGFGWTPAKVLAISGNSYRVLANGVQVTKDYPSEVRRIGPLTARDHAAGQYALGDRVVAHVDGGWVEGKVVATMGREYQVDFPNNRSAWVGPENLRPSSAPPPAAPKSGVAPKPGMSSCAGKIEGRYATTGSFGSFQIVFRSGKATMIDMGSNEEVFECWTGGGKILLHQPGKDNLDMPIDINDDGTLQTPLGEIKKKGS
jgi:hypothetical protein